MFLQVSASRCSVKLDAELGRALMSIGAVKGVEIGVGFLAAKLKGSEMNDQFTTKDGRIEPKTNRAGGILGGISTGAPIISRIAVNRLLQSECDKPQSIWKR